MLGGEISFGSDHCQFCFRKSETEILVMDILGGFLPLKVV